MIENTRQARNRKIQIAFCDMAFTKGNHSADGKTIEKRGAWGCETSPGPPFFGFIWPRLNSDYKRIILTCGLPPSPGADSSPRNFERPPANRENT